MKDHEAPSADKSGKPSWEFSTGQWMVDQLQLAKPEPAKTSYGLTPEDVVQLKEVAKLGSAHFFFPKLLEQRFKQEQRQSNRTERLSMSLVTLVLFAFGPVWAHWMLSMPEGTKTLELWLCLGVAVPVFAITALLQYYFVTSELAEGSLFLAFSVEVIIIEILRLHAAKLGVYLVPTLTAAVPIGVFALLGLSFRRRTILFVGYFVIIWFAGQNFGGEYGKRDVSVWMSEFIVLTLAWIAALFNRISVRRAWAANILLEISANQDSLTGLSNRSAFEERYEQQMRLGARYGKSSVLALIDLDHFKLVNDYYGHQYGDGVLVEVGVLLNDWARRPGDFAARIGGEEFALFLYDCTVEGATEHLNNMVKAVQALELEHLKSKVGFITISAGAVHLPATAALSEAYKVADINLYKAKETGRNRLVISELAYVGFI